MKQRFDLTVVSAAGYKAMLGPARRWRHPAQRRISATTLCATGNPLAGL